MLIKLPNLLCTTLVQTTSLSKARYIIAPQCSKQVILPFHRCSSVIKNSSGDSSFDSKNLHHHPLQNENEMCIGLSGISHHVPVENDISSRFSLPVFTDEEMECHTFTHCIRVIPYEYETVHSYAIGIQPLGKSENQPRKTRKKKSTQMQPSFVDFCPPGYSNLARRLGAQSHKGELLLKAVSPGKYGIENNGAIIYDLTAGFGQDSMILAHGKTSEIYMIERDPIVSLLLNDAMRRLKLIADFDVEKKTRAYELSQKLKFIQDDAVSFCQRKRDELLKCDNPINVKEGAPQPDVCYLDPMFPPRTKSAAVKKNMQILHGLFHTNETTSNDHDRCIQEKNLLLGALAIAKSRVVVKRPIAAPPLGTTITGNGETKKCLLPTFDLKGSVNRFDVYIL